MKVTTNKTYQKPISFLTLGFLHFGLLLFSMAYAQNPEAELTETQQCASQWIGALDSLPGYLETALETDIEQQNQANQNCQQKNVRAIRQVMALAYGTCEVLKPIDWWDHSTSGSFSHGIYIPRQPNGRLCDYNNNSSKSCRTIYCYSGTYQGNLAGVMDNHPYNKLPLADNCGPRHNACSIKGQALTNGEGYSCSPSPGESSDNQKCPVSFSMDTKPHAYLSVENDRNNINIFRQRSVDRNGSEFFGWQCSEYVTTAMALAGYRLVPEETANCGGVGGGDIGRATATGTSTKQQYAVSHYSNFADMDCSCLDTVDLTTDTIKAGDLITLSGDHIMMVEGVKQPLFKDIENINDCQEENMKFETLQIRLNHASATNAGPGSMRFFEHQYPNYIQNLERGYRKYLERCQENSSLNCNTEEDERQFRSYYFNNVALGLNDNPQNRWRQITSSSSASPQDIFGHSPYPMWPKVRKRLSTVCKIQFAKLNNSEPSADLTSTMASTKDVLKVIRHNSSKNGCVDNNPPSLSNNCVGNCEGYRNKCEYDIPSS